MSGIKIPEHCGAILLPETVLFPHEALPLHIFEERYRSMLDEALEDHCMICVGTLIKEESEPLKDCVHGIGTIGLIRTSREMEDGRSNLVLHGVARVHFSCWLDEKPYPLAYIVPMTTEPFSPEEGPLMILRMRDKVNEALTGFPPEIKQQANQALDQVKGDPSILADAIAQQFIQDSATRLQILSEPSLETRFDLLDRYLTVIRDQLRGNESPGKKR